MAGLFVTGTDTEVGKTLVTAALLAAYRRQGLNPAGMKPVAAGAELIAGRRQNEDAAAMRAGDPAPPPYEVTNPYLLAPPIAPHIAAARAGITIDLKVIHRAFATLEARYDPVVVEGAGGWLVPVGPAATLADVAVRLGLPVLLVVGIRLGCINHCLLTVEAVRARGLPLAGWVATYPAPYGAAGEEVVESLVERVAAPLVGVIPHRPGITPDDAAALLELERLCSPRSPAE